MAEFFMSWQLWEQMTFVSPSQFMFLIVHPLPSHGPRLILRQALACAMVIVVLVALVRNAWDWWNLRKHVRILKEQQAEQAKLLQTHPSIRERRRKSQVPFGVRAIQSGIEVEGVWISRPNSVFNSPSTTTPSSPMALQPKQSLGDKLAAAVREKEREDEYNNMTVATAARQLEAQTAGGRMVSPRATSDPFRDGTTPSERSGRSETGEVESYYNRRSIGTGNAYRDMPHEEAGYAAPEIGTSTQSQRASRQIYLSEPAYQADYFSASTHQAQVYIPSRSPDPRTAVRNTYVPHAPTRSETARRQSSYGGYSYPQGYSQASGGQTDSEIASPDEIDIVETYCSDGTRPERSLLTSNAPGRRSNYGMIFSDTSTQSPHTQSSNQHYSGSSSYGYDQRTTTPPPHNQQRNSDPFSTPTSSQSQSRRGSAPQQQWPLPQQATNLSSGQAVTTQITTTTRTTTAAANEPRDRAEAEAEALRMRHVNDGFSVARQGQRWDRASLEAAAGQAAEIREAAESQKKERKRLQKKSGRRDFVDEKDRRASQFRENI